LFDNLALNIALIIIALDWPYQSWGKQFILGFKLIAIRGLLISNKSISTVGIMKITMEITVSSG